MNQLSENIAACRRAKKMTQEALGNAVGVSMQAVSKWENGGVPDATLLPAIARTLGVSIDALFGLNPGLIDIEQTLAQDICAQSEGVPFTEHAFELLWAMQRASVSDGGINKDDCYAKFGNYHLQNLQGSGVSLMKLAPDFHYAFLAPAPKNGWQKTLIHCDEQTALFALLAQPDAFHLLVYLQSRDRNNPFTVKYLAKHIGVSETRIEELIPEFLRFELMDTRTLSLDDADTKVYAARPNPAIIPLLAFTQEVVKRPSAFSFTTLPGGAIFEPAP